MFPQSDSELMEDWVYYYGEETCECGHHHAVLAPIQLIVAECICGLLLEFNLEEYDGR